jgi:hypothetical protein
LACGDLKLANPTGVDGTEAVVCCDAVKVMQPSEDGLSRGKRSGDGTVICGANLLSFVLSELPLAGESKKSLQFAQVWIEPCQLRGHLVERLEGPQLKRT